MKIELKYGIISPQRWEEVIASSIKNFAMVFLIAFLIIGLAACHNEGTTAETYIHIQEDKDAAAKQNDLIFMNDTYWNCRRAVHFVDLTDLLFVMNLEILVNNTFVYSVDTTVWARTNISSLNLSPKELDRLTAVFFYLSGEDDTGDVRFITIEGFIDEGDAFFCFKVSQSGLYGLKLMDAPAVPAERPKTISTVTTASFYCSQDIYRDLTRSFTINAVHHFRANMTVYYAGGYEHFYNSSQFLTPTHYIVTREYYNNKTTN